MWQISVLAAASAALAELPHGSGAPRAWGASLLLLSAPVVLWQLPCAYVDVLSAAYALSGLLAVTASLEGPADDAAMQPQRTLLLYLGALWTGCAAASKALALAQVPFVGLLILLELRRAPQRWPRRSGALAAGLMCAPWAPYVLRNAWVYHNPLFPFASHVFDGGPWALAPAQLQVLERFMGQFGPHRGDTPLYGLQALLQLPYQLFFAARFGSIGFDGVIGFVLPAALVAWLVARRYRPQQRVSPRWPGVLGLFCAYQGLIWLSTSWQARFLVTAIWAAGLLFVYHLPQLPRAARLGLITITFGLQLGALTQLSGHIPALDRRIFGPLPARQALLRERVPGSQLCAQLATAPTPPSRVMLVWAQRLALWCPYPLWSDSYDEAATLMEVLAGAELSGAAGLRGASTAIMEQLRARHISHLLVDEAALQEIPAGLGVTERQALQGTLAAYAQLRRHHLRELAYEPPFALLALPPESAARAAPGAAAGL